MPGLDRDQNGREELDGVGSLRIYNVGAIHGRGVRLYAGARDGMQNEHMLFGWSAHDVDRSGRNPHVPGRVKAERNHSEGAAIATQEVTHFITRYGRKVHRIRSADDVWWESLCGTHELANSHYGHHGPTSCDKCAAIERETSSRATAATS